MYKTIRMTADEALNKCPDIVNNYLTDFVFERHELASDVKNIFAKLRGEENFDVALFLTMRDMSKIVLNPLFADAFDPAMRHEMDIYGYLGVLDFSDPYGSKYCHLYKTDSLPHSSLRYYVEKDADVEEVNENEDYFSVLAKAVDWSKDLKQESTDAR